MFFQKAFVFCCILLLVVELDLADNKISKFKQDPNKNKAKPQNKYSSIKGIPLKKSKEYKTLQTKTIPYGYIDGRHCNRQCDGTRLSCFFSFDLETFYAMSKACFNCPNVLADCYRPDCIVAGGTRRTVLVVNRQLPGPAIEVCQGDEVMVYLQNNLQDGEGTTIHWHGQYMKRDKYMDGVPWVTQCPILYNHNFTYELWADQAGTYWWHSHVEMQRGDGFFGAMIVRQAPQYNPHRNLYDFDLSAHVIMVGDWNNRLRLDVFEANALAGDSLEPTGILVNGYGFQSTSNITNTPTANFTVKQGKRYRFRFINVGFFNCPVEFSIDDHKLQMIATDGKDLQPFEVDSFVSSSGERFDFVLNANRPVSTYYIRIKGLLICARKNIFTTATLMYQGSGDPRPTGTYPTYATAAPTGGVLYNPISVNNANGYSRVYAIHQPRAVESLGSDLNTQNVCRFYITVDLSALAPVDPYLRGRTPQFNRISHKNLDVPLLAARFDIDPAAFCNAQTMQNRNCTNTFCKCPHVIEVPENAVVEFVFLELFDVPVLHPIHIHGYAFYVLGWGELGGNLTLQDVINLDQQGRLHRNFLNPPLKDTLSVPKGGYTIVRFRADNVGYWLLHCHIEVHASGGMELVIKVGDNAAMPAEPDFFPRCGNWPRY